MELSIPLSKKNDPLFRQVYTKTRRDSLGLVEIALRVFSRSSFRGEAEEPAFCVPTAPVTQSAIKTACSTVEERRFSAA
jgi:hypothetical protein